MLRRAVTLSVELMKDQPDGISLRGNLSTSTDQPNSKCDGDQKNEKENKMRPKCSQSSSPGTQGQENDTRHGWDTELRKEGAHLGMRVTE